MDNPWTLPPDRLRHVCCHWMRRWIMVNKNILLNNVPPNGCGGISKFVEEYDPYRTLSLICEWYDYCRKYDESKGHGIPYRIRYNTKFIDKLYKEHEEQYPNFHRSQDDRLIRELYDLLKQKYPKKRFTVTLGNNLKYVVHMIDQIENPNIIRFRDRDVLYEMLECCTS